MIRPWLWGLEMVSQNQRAERVSPRFRWTGGVSRGRLSESEGSDFRRAYGGTVNDCDLSFLAVERYGRPKLLGRLFDARRASAKVPAYRPKRTATLIPNAHPAAYLSSPRSNYTHPDITTYANNTGRRRNTSQPLHIFANRSPLPRFGPPFHVANVLNFSARLFVREEERKRSKSVGGSLLSAWRRSQEAVKINAFTGPSAAGARPPMVNGAERQTIATINAPQIPLSPSVQQSPVTQATPSTVGARSPLQTPGPLYAHGHGSAEAASRRHETTRMRSSIACTRCRRSKTKCDNNGIRDSTGALAACKSCVAGKRLCEYPAPQPANTSDSQRRESTVTPAGDDVSAIFLLTSFVMSCIVCRAERTNTSSSLVLLN